MRKYRTIETIIIGMLVSLLFTMMIYLLFAQFVVDVIIGNVSDYYIISTIILGFFAITMVVSYVTGFIINSKMKNTTIVRAGIMSLLIAFSVVIILAYIAAGFLYMEIFLYLEEGLAVRFSKRGVAVPNFEVKFPKEKLIKRFLMILLLWN